MKETIISQEDGVLVMDFIILDSWDDFEDLIDILQRYFYMHVTERVDGPESKYVNLAIDSTELTLINNPYGNTLRASTNEAKSALMDIHNNWSKYSKL